MTAAEAYARIDPIKSIATMRQSLHDLPDPLRREVILLGLASSRFQFTWSCFANDYGIPENDWPPHPNA